ncbi:DUF2891 domain-containing protein [Flavivirga eckloniae]|uniref:DUF2891 domain-containing protein n=1 Tax=Flavivirga eckloniae TaxID=1803846 RepID=A0A2K9PKK2_9FLAO|nr:DUF2891 domain-containing protein [Flavivirga eckloniae]AUP77584.1 DUF2891 domain-containing protein [Flavivirga eckloniae]
MQKYILLPVIALVFSCNTSEKEKQNEESVFTIASASNDEFNYNIPKLDLKSANTLAELPLHCINIEYPNKLSQTLGGDEDLKSPNVLHPAFYGCFDWHSAVHGHWSLISLIKSFPEMEKAEEIKQRLLQNISKENIEAEVAYFMGKHNKSYERTYGWAWLLKLAEEIHTWDGPTGRELEANLEPLTSLIIERYIEFLPRLNYPIRVGEHPNTAFGLSFAWDYANTVNHVELKKLIEQRAKDFYLKDTDCPITWEPSGYDFLSPCLEEAALMKRVLSTAEFKVWVNLFFPQLRKKNFELETGKVSDRNDGKLVHLDGVNFSRAWSLNKIAEGLPKYEHLKYIANRHINYSLSSIIDDGYEGGHWLGSFAIYALNSVKE